MVLGHQYVGLHLGALIRTRRLCKTSRAGGKQQALLGIEVPSVCRELVDQNCAVAPTRLTLNPEPYSKLLVHSASFQLCTRSRVYLPKERLVDSVIDVHPWQSSTLLSGMSRVYPKANRFT